MTSFFAKSVFLALAFFSASVSFPLSLPTAWAGPRELAAEIRQMSEARGTRTQGIDSWIDRTLPVLNKFNEIGLTISLNSLGKMKKARISMPLSLEYFLIAWEDAALEKMGRFSPQSLSNSLYSFFILGVNPSERFLEKWQERAERTIDQFNPQNLSNSLYAFSGLGIMPSENFLKRWQEVAEKSIQAFNQQNLSNSLYAFSVLEIQPNPSFLSCWEKRALEMMSGFSAASLQQISMAERFMFAKFQILMSPEFLLGVKGRSSKFKQPSRPSHTQNSTDRVAGPIELAAEIRKMPEASGLRTEDIDSWIERALPILSRFSEIGLTISLSSLVKMKRAHIPMPLSLEKFLIDWEDAALGKIRHFSPQGLSNSLYSFYMLGIQPSERFLEEWQERAEGTIEQFNPQNLSNSLYAFSGLGIIPSENFLKAWQVATEKSIQAFNQQNLSNSLYAFSVLEIQPSKGFIEAWQEVAERLMLEFSPQGLANSFSAFSALEIRPNPSFLGLWEKRALEKMSIFSAASLQQIFLAEKFLFAKLQIVMSPEFLLGVKERLPEFKRPPRPSHTQNWIFGSLKVIYPQDLREEYWAEEIASFVDFAVPSKKLIIQYDGPHHFVVRNGQETLRHQDRIMDFVLGSKGWTVLRLNNRDWDGIKRLPSRDRAAALKRILDGKAEASQQ